MATHIDDEEDLENLKRWWKDNWMALVAGLVIGVGVIGGWEGWKRYQDKRAAEASQIFEDLKKALTDRREQDATTMADKLAADFGSTPYAATAALHLAQAAIQGRKPEAAVLRLDWVIQHSDDPALQQLATLRKARVLWGQGQADAALKLLDGDAGAFTALVEELRGDIKLEQGDRDAARAAYEKALLATAADTAPTRELLQQKLDDLAGEPAPKVTPDA